jgi:hypothetical protein
VADRDHSIRKTIEVLCSNDCAGRRTGSPEGERARRFLASRFEALDLVEVVPGFVQPVPDVGGGNVLGMIPGETERTLLIAAHYDHLGRGPGGSVYWGADDNAAAVGIMLEVARRLQGTRLPKRVVFAAFDAEEPPHFQSETMGSQHFVRTEPIPIESIDMMICMDLMGHAIGGDRWPEEVRSTVFALGAEKSPGIGALVDSVECEGVHVRRLGIDIIPPLSDYYAFERANVPNLFLTCGRWQHYHTVTDTPEKLDHRKMIASAEYLTELVKALSRSGSTDFDREARDDSASLSTLRTFAAGISEADSILQGLEEQVAAHGALKRPEQHTLSMLAAMLESMLE